VAATCPVEIKSSQILSNSYAMLVMKNDRHVITLLQYPHNLQLGREVKVNVL